MNTGKINILADLTLLLGTTIDEFSIDGTLAGNSDDAVPTEKAVKTYVDALSFTEINDLEIDGANGIENTEIPIGTGTHTLNYKPLSGDVIMDNAGAVSVNDLSISGETAEDFLIFSGGSWVAKGGTELVEVISATYDMSTASGTQDITGVDFKPKFVICFSLVNSNAAASWGGSDGNVHKGIKDKHNAVANTWEQHEQLINLQPASGANSAQAIVNTFNSNGCTLGWTKEGSPTGTAQLRFYFFR